MAKAEATVEELVSRIERGQLQLPEMQRRYVWRATRVRDLLDSLYREYPSGAILLWDTDEPVPLQDFAVEQQSNPSSTFSLLLDGQQRLTSLSAVIRGKPVTVRGRKRPVEILFNLEHPEGLPFVTEVDEDDPDVESDLDDDDSEGSPSQDEADSHEHELQQRLERMTFVVSTRALEQVPHWVKVTEVFRTDEDAPFLQRAGITSFDDPRYTKYSQRLAKLRRIRRYVYRMDVLPRSLSYEEVTEIFVRVNSLGAKLRGSDLALAQITAKWKGSLAIFQAFQAACQDDGFPLDLGTFLKNMVAFATSQSRFLTVGGLSRTTLQKAWSDGEQGMNFALNFIRSNAGIDSPALLSSPYLLIALAALGHANEYELSPDDSRRLRHWALLANAKGRYTRGSSETLLDQDLATIRDGGGIDGLLDRLRTQMGRLDVIPEDLEGRTQLSALFKTMFLAFRAAKAVDWKSSTVISLGHRGKQHQLQFHHIFPKALLRGAYHPREADDIANLCFIGGRTNRQISDKQPAAYIPDTMGRVGNAPFQAQCIPTDPELLAVDSYRQFLARRRELICQRLNEFLSV